MKKLMPKIRFKNFIETWEQRKLGDVYILFKGKDLPLNSFYQGLDRQAIAYGHLYTQYAEVINGVELSSNDEGVMSKKGDILFPGLSIVPYGTDQSNAIMLDNVRLGEYCNRRNRR